MSEHLLTAFWFCVGLFFLGAKVSAILNLIRSAGEDN